MHSNSCRSDRLLNWASTYILNNQLWVEGKAEPHQASYLPTYWEVSKHLFWVLTNYIWFIVLLKNLLWSSGKCNIQWMETWQKRREKCSQNGKCDTGIPDLIAWRAFWGARPLQRQLLQWNSFCEAFFRACLFIPSVVRRDNPAACLPSFVPITSTDCRHHV